MRDENARVREENVLLKSQLESLQKEFSGYNVTKDEMEAALAVCIYHSVSTNVHTYNYLSAADQNI